MSDPPSYTGCTVRLIRNSALALALVAALGAALDAADVKDYLVRNSQKVVPGEALRADLLEVKGKRLFLLGESHAIAGNEKIDLALLQYLHRTAGVRFYVSESGYAACQLLNRYLENNDDKLLESVIQAGYGSPGWNKENFEFYKKLGEWNRGLPPGERVRLIGIDVEHQTDLAARYLSELLTTANVQGSIGEELGRLGKIQDRMQALRELVASVAAKRAEYATALGERFEDFDIVVTNVGMVHEYRRTNAIDLRDRVMYETLLRVHKRHPEARYFGRWGNAHVPQRATSRGETCASRLESNSEWKGKVLSILSFYHNSRYLSPDDYQSRPAPNNGVDTALFAAAAGKSPFSLFRLDGPASPFLDAGFELVKGTGAPASYAQYVLLVQDAPAAQPFAATPPARSNGAGPGVATARPVVIRTVPEAGAVDVPADLEEIRVTFSKAMAGGMTFAMCPPMKRFPNQGMPRWETGQRTIVMKVKLAPDTDYGMWLNDDEHQNFVDTAGRRAVPYLYVFRTKAK